MPRAKIQGLVAVVIGVVGVTAGTVLVQNRTGFLGRAWSGLETNLSNLGVIQRQQPGFSAINDPAAPKAKALFETLQAKYYDAEVQNIDIPQFNIKGSAFVKFDPSANKSFVFAAVSNLPGPANKIPRAWLLRNLLSPEYLQAGPIHFLREGDSNVGYVVFARDNDVRSFSTLILSYDSPDAVQPELPVITLKF